MTEAQRIKKYRAKRKREGFIYLQALVHKSLVVATRKQIAQDETLRKQTRTPSGKGDDQ